MSISLETLFSSRIGLSHGFGVMQPATRYRLPGCALDWRWLSARKHDPSVRAVRSNQWVIHSGNIFCRRAG